MYNPCYCLLRQYSLLIDADVKPYVPLAAIDDTDADAEGDGECGGDDGDGDCDADGDGDGDGDGDEEEATASDEGDAGIASTTAHARVNGVASHPSHSSSRAAHASGSHGSSRGGGHCANQTQTAAGSNGTGSTAPGSPASSGAHGGGSSAAAAAAARQKKRGIFPKVATNIMRAWLFQHLSVRIRTESSILEFLHIAYMLEQLNDVYVNFYSTRTHQRSRRSSSRRTPVSPFFK